MSHKIDPTLWTQQPKFGVAGGPLEVVLTEEGLARAFSVGAQVQRGKAAEALEALAEAGTVLLLERYGTRLKITEIGRRFSQTAWCHLTALGYIEDDGPNGIRLTDTGRCAVERGYQERESLLERCRQAADSTRLCPGCRSLDGEHDFSLSPARALTADDLPRYIGGLEVDE